MTINEICRMLLNLSVSLKIVEILANAIENCGILHGDSSYSVKMGIFSEILSF